MLTRTNAGSPRRINGHSSGTLTDEGAHGVHALPVDTHPRENLTLVHICMEEERMHVIQKDKTLHHYGEVLKPA